MKTINFIKTPRMITNTYFQYDELDIIKPHTHILRDLQR